jgi:hypothetical protein
MAFQSDHIAEARANVAAHQASEQARIDRLVREASKSTEAWAAEQEAAQRKVEQDQEAALQASFAQKEAAIRAGFERRYLLAGGVPEQLEQTYQRWRADEALRTMEAQQAAYAAHLRSVF